MKIKSFIPTFHNKVIRYMYKKNSRLRRVRQMSIRTSFKQMELCFIARAEIQRACTVSADRIRNAEAFGISHICRKIEKYKEGNVGICIETSTVYC